MTGARAQEMDGEPTTILVVDDDAVLRAQLARALRGRGYEVQTAASHAEATALAQADTPELALVDLNMPGKSGLELVRDLRALDPTTKIVVLTGYGSIATAVDAIQLGATHYLAKPADVDEILAAFERAAADTLAPRPADFATPSLARAEWELIQRVMSDCAGNVSEAARRLGLHRRSLQRKLWKMPPAT